MRIALVNSEYSGPGGIGTYTRNIAAALACGGHAVTVLSKLESDTVAFGSEVRVIPIKRAASSSRIFRGVRYRLFWEINLHLEYAAGVCRTLESLFCSGQLDIAEIPDFFGEAFSAQRRFPYVCRLHTPWGKVQEWNALPRRMADRWITVMERRTVRNAWGISSPSAALLEVMPKSWLPDGSPRSIIPYPIEAGFLPPPLEKEFSLELLFLGRLEQRKGFDWVCLALPKVLAEFPNAGLVIAGAMTDQARPWMDRLVDRLNEKGLGNRLRYLGPVSPKQACGLMQRADVVMVPSRFDNFPNVVLEAMAAGRCILACKAGGIPEMVENDSSALLFDPEHGETGLERILLRALADAGLRERLGRGARARAETLYSPVAVAKRTVEFYEEVLSRWNN